MMITRLYTLITILTLLFASQLATAAHLGDHLLLSARIDGAQEVPMVATDALGVAGLTLNGDRDELCVSISVNGLSGPITAAHIHAGAAGMTGDPILDLSEGILGSQISITFSTPDLTSAIVARLLQGKTYINIHTAANPMGEIRGQIILESDWSFVADANGGQEVPAVMTDARGLGKFTLSKDQSSIKYQFIAENLSGPITGAHLHIGAPGMTGGVEQNLSADIDGNVMSGSFVPTAWLLMNLLIGDVYLNVHTDANPMGEIRGQLSKHDLSFDASLNGAQEVPVSISLATGVATMHANTTLDTIWYVVQVEGLSGEITGAHLHDGAVGVSGDPIVDFSDDIDGNRLSGIITGDEITEELIHGLLTGETYINLHTSLFPSGEIRGQVYRLAREGYTTLFTGGQEVPSVETSAYGSGIVSINREQTNAHFMFVVGNLPSPITGAHFHSAAMGESGDAIFNLTPYFMGTGSNDAAFGYWKNDDAMPFTSEQSLIFRNDEVYVNLHTDENPMGEIRGQINRGVTCYNLLAVDKNEAGVDLEVYPNPFTNLITLQTKNIEGDLTIEIINIKGQVVLATTTNGVNNTIQIATNDLTNGLYFILVKNEAGLLAIQKIAK